MMKHILLSCDSCPAVMPQASVRGWWGIAVPKKQGAQFAFAPLVGKNHEQFSKHACSIPCLQQILQASADSVDLEKVKEAKQPSIGDLMYLNPFRAFTDDSGPHDSTGYYGSGKPKSGGDDSEESE